MARRREFSARDQGANPGYGGRQAKRATRAAGDAALPAPLDTATIDKLAALGLVEPPQVATLEAFINDYLSGKQVEENTLRNDRQARNRLVKFFGAKKRISEISEGDADRWHNWLKRECGLSPPTVRRECGREKEFFEAARRRSITIANPFERLQSAVLANPERQFYVTPEMAEKVLKACPDAQWKMLFSLARYGGLRCPTEILALRWGDVDFQAGRIRVTSPKTKRYEGKGQRTIPLFPELRDVLQEALDEAVESGKGTDADPLITRYRDTRANLRTQAHRIIKGAWPGTVGKGFPELPINAADGAGCRSPLRRACCRRLAREQHDRCSKALPAGSRRGIREGTGRFTDAKSDAAAG